MKIKKGQRERESAENVVGFFRRHGPHFFVFKAKPINSSRSQDSEHFSLFYRDRASFPSSFFFLPAQWPAKVRNCSKSDRQRLETECFESDASSNRGDVGFPSLFLDAVLILPSKKPSLHFKPHRLAAPNALGPHALRSWRRCRWLPAAAERFAAAAAAGSNRSSSSSGPVAIEGSVEEVDCCCCCCRLDRRCCSYFSRPFGPLGQDTQRCCCV